MGILIFGYLHNSDHYKFLQIGKYNLKFLQNFVDSSRIRVKSDIEHGPSQG